MVELGQITKLCNQSMPIYMPGKYPWNPDQPHIYSEIMNNCQGTNFSFSQEGSAEWDYRITAISSKESASAHQSGWELSSPALAVMAGPGPGKLPASAGFISLSPENAVVTAFKMAEDKNGYIIRVYEAEGRAVKAELGFPKFKVKDAWLADGVERDQAKLEIKQGKLALDLGPYEVKTIRVRLQNQ
jgi:alpha-mannosidase